ncbi:hypothetical protein [uncultured Pontibacter sp.]|uniref:hypothetical protein n=1 Tax=uncultured Pontibacter sp. TaxID=453356 RepID=UPI002633F05C|nr:hypothetical protein [uncultured Pontibacter sp.]
MIEFENSYLQVWVDQDLHLMHSEWLRNVTSDEYRQGNILLTEMLHQHAIRHWIADSASLGEICPEDVVWTIQELAPRIIYSPVLKIARVSGEDRISYVKFKEFMEKASINAAGSLEVRQFISYKEAADWIGQITS